MPRRPAGAAANGRQAYGHNVSFRFLWREPADRAFLGRPAAVS